MTRAALDGVQAYRVESHDGRTGSVATVLPRAGRGKRGVLLVGRSPLWCELAALELVERERRRVRVISHV